jgi:cell division protein FtsQ
VIVNSVPAALGFDITKLGFPASLANQTQFQSFPGFQVSGLTGVGGSGSAGESLGAHNSWDQRGSLTWVKGSHTIKFGGDYRVQQLNHFLANTLEPLLPAALGVSKGDPILGFSLELVRQRVESLSWVEHATIERRLPDTVVVFLQERRPFAIWQNQAKFVLIDRTGQVVANQNVAEFRQLPLVVGAGAPAAAATLIDALTDRPDLQKRIIAAVRVGERRWNLRLNNGADVMLPEGHEVQAIDRLMQLQQQHALLDRPLAAIDMRLGDRLVLRPRPDEKKPT